MLALLLLLVASDICFARYGAYEGRNLIEREEPLNDENGELVECPVCDDSRHWMPSNEQCLIEKGGKTYKRCKLGTYINEVCGNRLDCYRGAGEQCTVKRDFDPYGQKCAPGYYCNKPLGKCQGIDYVVDSKIQYILNPTPYSRHGIFKNGFDEGSFIRRN